MTGTRFGDSFDPAFDVRAAEMSKAATVQQEAADAADGGNSHVSTPEPAPAGGGDDNTIEQIGGNLGDAAGDALLAAASIAPPVAAAAAVIDQGEVLLDAGKDAANFANDAAGEVGGALEDLFGGGDDVPPGTSTFPVDPDAPVPTETPGEANARGDAIRSEQQHFDEHGGGGGYVFNADDERGGSFGDFRQQDVSDHDVHAQADNSLDLDSGIAGAGAAGADAVAALDDAFEPVSASDPHTWVGGADAGAPDGVFEPVVESEPHTTVGFVPAADDLPTVDGVQTEVPVGSDVQLNPQPIPPGMGADIGEPVTEAAASAGPDVADSSIIIVGRTEAAVGAYLGGGGAAVSLNPQPIQPGIDLHPPSPIAEAGAEGSLNSQPIPPGADIGEPVAEAAAAAAPSTGDSSIIIVGGAEAPVLSEVPNVPVEAPVVVEVEVPDAPMEDVASSIAVELDGPSFSAAESRDWPIEVSIADDSLDG